MAVGVTREHRSTTEPAGLRMSVLGYATRGRDDEQIRQACVRRRWSLVEMIREDPARSRRRWALEYALERLGEGQASGLVVARLEALCQSLADLGDVLEAIHGRGGRLLCIEPEIDTRRPDGLTVVRALSAVSRQERERLAARTREGLARARQRRASARPALDDRPELKQRIIAMRDGGMTLQAIADVLNDEGTATLRGGERWRPSSLHSATSQARRGQERAS